MIGPWPLRSQSGARGSRETAGGGQALDVAEEPPGGEVVEEGEEDPPPLALVRPRAAQAQVILTVLKEVNF